MTKEDIAVRGNVDDDDFARIRRAVEDPKVPAAIALDQRSAERDAEREAIVRVLNEATDYLSAAFELEKQAAEAMAEAKVKGIKYGSGGVLAALGLNHFRGG